MSELNIAQNIKNVKKTYNYTNKQLAEMTGISISSISKILAGIIKSPSLEAIAKIADALNVSIDVIVYGKEAKKTKTTSNHEFQLLENFRMVNDERQNAILSYSKKMRELTENAPASDVPL